MKLPTLSPTVRACAMGMAASMCVMKTDAHMHSLSSLYSRVSPAVYTVESFTSNRDPDNPQHFITIKNGTGTAFAVRRSIVDRAPLIVTNFHVVSDAEVILMHPSSPISDKNNIKVTTFQRMEIKAVDVMHDIAILEPIGNDGITNIYTTAPLLCSRDAYVSEPVAALGSPYGLDDSLTSGIVSGLHRDIHPQMTDMIQTDANINPGNSGGPLVTVNDKCILGINTATISTQAGGGASGIGFAVPGKYIRAIAS